jgi:hypothetical protein
MPYIISLLFLAVCIVWNIFEMHNISEIESTTIIMLLIVIILTVQFFRPEWSWMMRYCEY